MFRVIDLDSRSDWNNIVLQFNDSTVYDDINYLLSLKHYTKSKMKLFYYEYDACKLYYVMQINDIAELSYFNTSIPRGKFFDMETPYGYGGLRAVKFDENIAKKFVNEVCEYCKSQNIVSQFIRFTPFTKNYNYSRNISNIVRQKSTICMYLNNCEQIMQDIDSKNRNMIRKAIKNGLNVQCMNEKNFDRITNSFIKLYKETMDRNNASSFYYFSDEYFNEFFRDMRGKYEIFYVEYGEKIIALAIIMKDKNNIHYHLSAADRSYMKFAPNNLLLYNVAIWGMQKGYKLFHLGGGVTDNDSLFSFKKTFSKNGVCDFYIGSNVFMQEVYDYLIEIRKQEPEFDMQKNYMIKYRQE